MNPRSDYYLNQSIEIQTDQIISSKQLARVREIVSILEICFSLIGVVTNVINIRVFLEQGVAKSSTNIGLFSLSIFDLLNCSLMMPSELCVIFDFTRDRLKKMYCHTFAPYGVFIASVFYYCSHWTTVYLSIERALCVVMPLKVKLIFRPKVTVIVIASSVVISSLAQMTYTSSTRVLWFLDTVSNQTVPTLGVTHFGQEYFYFYSLIFNTILSTAAIFVVAIATAIMILKINQIQKWRLSNTRTATSVNVTSSENKGMSSKDAEMVKSVTTVTCIFLVCLSAGHVPATVVLLIPGVNFGGAQENLFNLTYLMRFLFSLVNSSINFFFYIRISSRYKTAFAAAFPKCSNVISTNKEVKDT